MLFVILPVPHLKTHKHALTEPIIIDHTCTDVSQIPDSWINKVKDTIKLHYAHTSHGEQLIAGIKRLANSALPVYDPRLTYVLQYNSLPDAPDLCIMDGQMQNTYIAPGRYWKDGGDIYTRDTLRNFPAINVSMFAWCQQMEGYTEADTKDYLDMMTHLELAYPQVTFVYMTGNAQTSGSSGYNRFLRNEQIREYCRQNNKVLFDFADLDAWFNGEQATYTYNDQQIPIQHPKYAGGECNHTTSLSCENKGKALWWLLARIAGWGQTGCDFNQDGVLNAQDFIDKQKSIIQKFERWEDECWYQRKDCGDFNKDGNIDENDREEKYLSLMKKLESWGKNCNSVMAFINLGDKYFKKKRNQ